MLAKERPVLAPGFERRLDERAAYRKKHLGGLADRLDYPVCRAPERQDGDRGRENPNRGRRGPQRAKRAPDRACEPREGGVRTWHGEISYPVKSPAKGPLMHENDVSAEKLAADLKLVISDAEALLRATVGQAGETTAAARAKMQESLESVKLKLGPLGEEVAEKARAADDYVRANPWQAVGIAVLAGIALRLLVSRR